MTDRVLYAGPQYPSTETAAFDALSPIISDAPRSLLYITRSDHTERLTRERWAEHGRPLSLSFETFDSIVSDCYERDQYAGRSTYIDQPLRDRLVELAVETIEDPSNPLTTDERIPASGLCEQVEDLLSLMEFADLHSSDAIHRRLETEGLDVQAETVSAVAAAFEDAREELLDANQTLRAERYHHVVTNGSVLTDAFPSVDAVVLGDFTLFSPLERRLVERLAETWPTVALLPQVTTTPAPNGVDRGAERALDTYEALGFEHEYVPADRSPDLDVARELYQPASTASADGGHVSAAALDLRQPETIPDELRFVARDVRQRVAAGTPAEEIGVVLSNPGGYHERLVETFEQYDVPATLAIEQPFGETALGEVIGEVATLSREDPPLASLTALLSNPLVTGLDDTDSVDRTGLAHVASRLTSRRLETALDHLDPDDAATIRSFLDDLAALRAASLGELPDQVDALLDRLGVTESIDVLPKTPRGRTERAAKRSLSRALETLAMTDGLADLDRGDALDRLERALQGVSLDANDAREGGHVLVCGMDEAVPREFEHVYVLGLTMGHFPSNPERLAFTRPINEAHPDFEQTDVQQTARYRFGLLLASDASLTLSIPERDLGGDPYVEADVITELRRVTDLDPDPVPPDETPPGAREDVQRSLARTFAHDGVNEYDGAIDRAAEAGTFEAARQRRLQAGTACAAARASPDLTEYDGQLSPETIATLHGPDVREPYSASRLETYAKCGFKYYMGRVLDIDEPDDIGLEPDARERGGFVHDVLERYYADLQSDHGDLVPIRGDRDERESHLLETAIDVLVERFDDDPTAFQHQWLVDVFAGLGDPSTNPFYGDNQYGAPEQGLLVRFLDHEFETVSKATALPAWLEPRIGTSYGDETLLSETPVTVETPDGAVTLAGKIDRIDLVPETTPSQAVVRDYKTGGTPSEKDTLGGLAFQLPLYALLAEGVLDGVETVGGSYYQVKPPSTVSHREGLVTSQANASYYKDDESEVSTPLLRASYPTFETHEAFRTFIDEETPSRLGELADAITEGAHHPTILAPRDAGCRYCGYSDVCDVRPHRRRDVMKWIDENDATAYVPLAATDEDPADVLEVN